MVNFIRILGIFYLYLFTGFAKFAHIFFFIIVRFIVWGFLNKYSWSHLIDLCFGLIAQAYDYLSRYLALHLPYLTGHMYICSQLFTLVSFCFQLECTIYYMYNLPNKFDDRCFFLLSGVYHQSQLIRQIVYGICKKIYIQFILQLNNIP